MKPLLLLTAIVLFLSYCNGNDHKAAPGHEQHTDAVTTSTAPSGHTEHSTKLTLNNGQKWKLDEPTRKNIGEIKSILDKAAAQPAPDYHQVATDLQAATDKLIGQCRMSGPDHDALHLWLQDYLPALKELHSTDKSIQQAAFQTVRTEVNQFGEYFE